MPASIRKWNLSINTQYVRTASCKSVITNMATLRSFDITPRNRILLEKLNGFSTSQEIPSILWNRIHNCLPPVPTLARSIQLMLQHPTSWRYILYYYPIYAWVFQVASFPQVYPPKPYIHLSSPPCVLHARLSHYSRFDQPNGIKWGVHTIKQFSLLPCYLVPPPALILCPINLIWTVLVIFLQK